MLIQGFIFITALYMVVRGALLATKYAARLAESFKLSAYTVGFIVIAIISILPETFIAVNAALTGNPAFGFGMLLGSNVIDLTLVFALIVLLSRRPLRVESRILQSHAFYPFILVLPIILGLDGHLSRAEGIVLIIGGIIFYYLALKHGDKADTTPHTSSNHLKPFLFLLLSMGLLLIGSHFTVASATELAHIIGISPVLIGMLIVSLGTTLPEFVFSLNAVKAHEDSLAIGDILGTVLADATIVVGLIALIHPFFFPPTIIYIAGIFMVAASFILFSFMRSGHSITSKEAFVLCVFWLTFVLIETVVTVY